jgi:hypothetical protein
MNNDYLYLINKINDYLEHIQLYLIKSCGNSIN